MNMMESLSIQSLIQNVCSGVIHVEHLKEGETIGSGSGFVSNKLLITNNHVYAGALTATEVKLSWQPSPASFQIEKIVVPSAQFQSYLKAGSDENNYDFAILDIPELPFQNLYNFTLDTKTEVNIGDDALILGFPLEHENLVCHRAMVSSLFVRNNVKNIQLDASVNQSNSGGPLVDPRSGSVIGIVTRKGTGLSQLFDTLIESFDNNIVALSRITGAMTIGDIDPVRALIASQHQMKLATKEIERSANVGIGYAFSIEYADAETKRLSQ